MLYMRVEEKETEKQRDSEKDSVMRERDAYYR